MLCPICHGRHFILESGRPLPCPECQGFGEVHCCDGLAEQPDSPEAAPPPPEESENADFAGAD
jgi:hypothetical protein